MIDLARNRTLRLTLFAGAACLPLVACSQEDAATPPPATEVEAAASEAPAQATPSQEFLAMAERHAARYLKANPEAATSLGVSPDIAGRGYGARLGSYGDAGNFEAEEMNERFLEQLRRFERSELEGTALVTYDVLKNAYETAAQRNSFDFGNSSVAGSNSPYVLTQISGPHIELPQMLLTQHPLATSSDVLDYLARLEEIGRVMDEVAAALNADANAGVVPPVFALEKIAASLESFTSAPAEESLLVTHLADSMADIDGMSDDDRQAKAAEAARLVEEVVYPSYAMLADTVLALVEESNDDAGIWRIEEGEDFYQHALNSYGAEGKTAAEIHQLGLDEVARIEGEMDAIFQSMGMSEGTVGERFASIAERPDSLYPNTDEGREELLGELRDQVDAVMALSPDWFGTLPPQAVEVRRIPVYEQDSAPGGYYTSPSLDGTRPGIYWINLKNTADWPKYTLKTLTYHEAVPGHHFQIALQMDVDDFPLMRNTFFYSEYSEGWALYAEQVAAEMGMYEDDPLGDLGRLQSELFRAVRLVTDTGLHDKQWTREQAIDYMVDTLGDTRDSVTREVERYCVWPGQATSYKLGMLKIGELRNKAEAELGDDFDIREFHDEILLAGAMPLPVLNKRINEWIAAKKG